MMASMYKNLKLFQINTDKSKASSLAIHSYATLKNIDIIAIQDPYNIKTINKTHFVMLWNLMGIMHSLNAPVFQSNQSHMLKNN